MFWRTARVACVVSAFALLAAVSCGGSSTGAGEQSTAGQSGGGSSGSLGRAGGAGRGATAGSSGGASELKCGSATCKAVTTPIQGLEIPACCADASSSQCGLDSAVLAQFSSASPQGCQPLDQPGKLDTSCADSPATDVSGFPLQFKGCCRDNGTCGYMIDQVAVIEVGLGCVDSAPFLDGGTPAACGNR